jgi:hypothetical protein
MKTKLLFLGVLVFAGLSCENKNEPIPAERSGLIGSWVNPSYGDSTITYSKGAKPTASQYGITFLNAGDFVERANSGWCATPPVALVDNKGTWTVHDSIISINVAFWGGEVAYNWKIITLTADQLKVKVLTTKYTNKE